MTRIITIKKIFHKMILEDFMIIINNAKTKKDLITKKIKKKIQNIKNIMGVILIQEKQNLFNILRLLDF